MRILILIACLLLSCPAGWAEDCSDACETKWSDGTVEQQDGATWVTIQDPISTGSPTDQECSLCRIANALEKIAEKMK